MQQLFGDVTYNYHQAKTISKVSHIARTYYDNQCGQNDIVE